MGSITLSDKQQNEYWHATENVYEYVVPERAGDSYYILNFSPFDENISPSRGHFYVYRGNGFWKLESFGQWKNPLHEKSYITVKCQSEWKSVRHGS